jgi:hypothetical protein
MIKLTLAKAFAVGASLLVASATLGTGTAAAYSPMPLSSKLRACDFTQLRWVPAVGNGRAVAFVGPDGNGNVVAKVDLATALPDMRYDVRVIQTPRPSAGCAAGDPGVTTGVIQTDATGAGSVSVTAPIASGKAGAWVVVDRPAQFSQTPAEFYTSDFIAKF